MFRTRVINYNGKNFEQRTAIKFCCKAVFTDAKMWETFVKVFSNSSVSCAMVFRWHSQLAASEESVEDAERSGRPGTMKMKENITRLAAVLKDCCASYRTIAKSTGYRWKSLLTTFCLMIWKNKNCAHDLCRMRWQWNNRNSVFFTQKT